MVTRGSNTYGPNQYPEKFVPLFVTNAIDEQPLPLYGDGRQRRDWLAVEDYCSAIEHVFFQGEPGQIYNIGGGNEWENIAVAEQIVRHLGKSRDLIRSVQDRLGHDRRYAVDCSKLRRLGGVQLCHLKRDCARLSNGIKSMRTGGEQSSLGNFASTTNSSIVSGFKKG